MPSCVCPPPRASSAVFGVSGVSHSGSGERVLGLGWAADPHFPDLTASARETPTPPPHRPVLPHARCLVALGFLPLVGPHPTPAQGP